MAANSKIEWTDRTWNPVTGCSKVSQGCKNCYALRDWARLSAPREHANIYTGRVFTDVQCHPERLGELLRKKKPEKVFVNSMSDLFHEQVPFDFIDQVFAVMAVAPHLTYQILTKRPERMADYVEELYAGRMYAAAEMAPNGAGTAAMASFAAGLPNVWLGVSVEDQETVDERLPPSCTSPRRCGSCPTSRRLVRWTGPLSSPSRR